MKPDKDDFHRGILIGILLSVFLYIIWAYFAELSCEPQLHFLGLWSDNENHIIPERCWSHFNE